MNLSIDDIWLLKQAKGGWKVSQDNYARRLSELADRDFVVVTPFVDEASKPFPAAICEATLTPKGREAIDG